MTHRERLLAALEWQPPDRVPLDIWIRPELWLSLKQHCGISDDAEMREHLGIDWAGVGCRVEYTAEFKERLAAQGVEGASVIYHPEGSQENMWGTLERPGADGMYKEWVSGPFKDAADMSRFNFPDLSVLESVEGIQEQVNTLHQRGFPTAGGASLPFKCCWLQRGLENFLADLYINPEFAETLLDWWYQFETERGRRIAAAGADIIMLVGDIGMQDRLLIDPAKWREIEKPRMAHMFAAWKAAGTAKPPYIFYHSDGNVSEIVPDLIEIGLDILNPLQPECMDIEEIGRKYGRKRRFHGAISVQRTLPFGSEADVRAEVRHRLQHLGPRGGYVLCPANAIQTDTPVTNVLAMYEEAREYSAKIYSR